MNCSTEYFGEVITISAHRRSAVKLMNDCIDCMNRGTDSLYDVLWPMGVLSSLRLVDNWDATAVIAYGR